MGRTKEPEICKLCGRPITGGDPYRVNFEAMVDRAGWNMSFQPKMVICHDCSDNMLAYLESGLSSVIRQMNTRSLGERRNERWYLQRRYILARRIDRNH